MGKKKVKTKEKASIEKFWGGWNIAEALILMVAGILGIVVGAISVANADNQDMQNVATTIGNIIPFVAGLFICMDAVMRVVISFTKFQKESDESAMMIGAFEVTVGIIIMIFYRSFTELVADFVAIFMIAIGVLLIIFSIFTISKRKAKIFIPVLEILFSAVLIAIGIAILIIYYQDNGNVSRQRLVLIITGAILFITGIVFLIATCITRKKQVKEHEEEEKARLEQKQAEKKRIENTEVIDYTSDDDSSNELAVVDNE